MSTLVIAEKQIAAARLAEILSGGKAKKTGKGKIPIYKFKVDAEEFRVVGLSGHVVKVDYPSELNRWNSVDPRQLIFADPIKKVPRDSKAIVTSLQDAADGVDKVIIATDYDREGELIGLEGLELLRKKAPDVQVKRARFSSLTAKEVKQAFKHTVDLDLNLAHAGESRQHVDLVWGAVLTRIISAYASRRGRDFLSVGRVQSPTLALIVDLEKKIKNFKPQDYWLINANLGVPPPFDAFHLGPARGGKTPSAAEEPSDEEEPEEGEIPKLPARAFPDQAEAERIYKKIEDAKEARVTSVERSTRTESAPAPFNTTSFLQAASSMGVSAGRAMNLAEGLYMRGFISYPRTDNTVYPATEDLDALVENLRAAQVFAPDVEYLKTVRRPQPTRGKKEATDHPPIHPVEAARKQDVDEDSWRVYELVVRRFLATLAKDSTGENLRVGLDIKQEPFRATGYVVQFWGWKKLYPYSGSADRPLPSLQEGQTVPVNKINLEGKQTQPPKRFGQGRLIAEMERLGLGTKSTRHDIIEKLIGRRYLKGPKQLEPTLTGFAVTDVLERYAEVVTQPAMTAQLEEEMELVEKGKRTLPEVVKDSRELLERAVTALETSKDQISKELTEVMRQQADLGPCPRCSKSLLVRRSRFGKQFVGCSGYPDCTQTYPLPQAGMIQPTGVACDACKAPMVRLIRGGRAPWEFCCNMDCPKRAERQAQAAAVEGSDAAEVKT